MNTQLQSPVLSGTYKADPIHSTVGFEIAYMGLLIFGSQFKDLDADISVKDGDIQINGRVKTETIGITEPNLRGHLISQEFFWAEQYPDLEFKSTQIQVVDGKIQGMGDLTIKGITHPVDIKGSLQEPIIDAYGNERLGLELRTSIDRTDFDMLWNNILPSGQKALANKVKIRVNIQAVKSVAKA